MPKKKEKKESNNLHIISFEANFDTSSPNATIVKLSRDGGKLTLEFSENQMDALIKLVKFGKNNSFTIYADINNVLKGKIETLVAEKIEFLDSFLSQLDVSEFRNQLRNICSEEKNIDIDKLTDTQVKAITLLSIYDKDTRITDTDVAFILKIPLATIKIWQTNINFKKAKNVLNKFNLLCADGDALQIAWQNAQRNADGNSMKYIMNFLGLLKEVPVLNQNFNFLSDKKERNKDVVDELLKDLYGSEK